MQTEAETTTQHQQSTYTKRQQYEWDETVNYDIVKDEQT